MSHQHDHDHDHQHDHNHDHDHEYEHEHEHVHMEPDEYAAAFRAAKDEFMHESPDSPLSEEQRATFEGLAYYPYNPDLALTVELDRNVPEGTVTMDTSTGSNREYPRAGKVHFEVDGQPAEVTIYGDADDLFLPLRDSTSGKETYGAGRYLEPEMIDDDTVLVDFNFLYNPYCAYNERYSCPLPPVENWLRVPIRAGEQNFGYAE
ncbi:MAG TPA: DUF1684 domain-containing protein [Chloroflexota bacterium]